MTSTIVPCLRYRDAPRMIDWLCKAFGFKAQLVVPNEDGTIAHAQLTYGGGMIMVGSATAETEWGRNIRQPAETGGMETQCPYVVAGDVDAIYARARAAGADIVIEIKNHAYGSRDFTCRDPEGHLWSFGTYDPWAQ